MALGDPYITTAELKMYAKITDSDDDTSIANVVVAISRNIERFTGRQYNDAGSATARTYAATNSHHVEVDDFSTVNGLVVETDTGLDGAYATAIASTSYTLFPLNGVVEGQTGWPYRKITLHTAGTFTVSEGRPLVQVTARWGWSAVPADIKQAALIQGARIFGRRESVHGVLGAGDFVVRVSNRLDPDVEEMLRHYKFRALVA